MSPISVERVAWALALGLPLLLLVWNVQRMRGEVRKIVHVAEDLVVLLKEGDFARATSRLNDVGGSLGEDVQAFLHRLLQRPWVGAGDAVRIAEDHVEPRGLRLMGVLACVAGPVGLFVALMNSRGPAVDLGWALVVFGLVVGVVVLALPLYSDSRKRAIIRSVHEVQHAAEDWLKAHREPGQPII